MVELGFIFVAICFASSCARWRQGPMNYDGSSMSAEDQASRRQRMQAAVVSGDAARRTREWHRIICGCAVVAAVMVLAVNAKSSSSPSSSSSSGGPDDCCKQNSGCDHNCAKGEMCTVDRSAKAVAACRENQQAGGWESSGCVGQCIYRKCEKDTEGECAEDSSGTDIWIFIGIASVILALGYRNRELMADGDMQEAAREGRERENDPNWCWPCCPKCCPCCPGTGAARVVPLAGGTAFALPPQQVVLVARPGQSQALAQPGMVQAAIPRREQRLGPRRDHQQSTRPTTTVRPAAARAAEREARRERAAVVARAKRAARV